jgi:hypothetical protein
VSPPYVVIEDLRELESQISSSLFLSGDASGSAMRLTGNYFFQMIEIIDKKLARVHSYVG